LGYRERPLEKVGTSSIEGGQKRTITVSGNAFFRGTGEKKKGLSEEVNEKGGSI